MKKILVGEAAYSIKRQRTIRDGKERLCGLCDGEKKWIKIRKEDDDMKELMHLIHELLHAIEFEWDIEIPHKLVHQLEEPIARLIIDNQLDLG